MNHNFKFSDHEVFSGSSAGWMKYFVSPKQVARFSNFTSGWVISVCALSCLIRLLIHHKIEISSVEIFKLSMHGSFFSLEFVYTSGCGHQDFEFKLNCPKVKNRKVTNWRLFYQFLNQSLITIASEHQNSKINCIWMTVSLSIWFCGGISFVSSL